MAVHITQQSGLPCDRELCMPIVLELPQRQKALKKRCLPMTGPVLCLIEMGGNFNDTLRILSEQCFSYFLLQRNKMEKYSKYQQCLHEARPACWRMFSSAT